MATKHAELPIYLIGCEASAVERELAEIKGVVRIYINPATEKAYIDFDPDVVQLAVVQQKATELGCAVGAPIQR